MPKNWTLSKSQYCQGVKCPKALWLYRHRKDLLEESDNVGTVSGDEVGEAAKKRFPQGVEVEAEYYQIDQAVRLTKNYINEGKKVLFEATAQTPDGHYARIDVLKKVQGKDEWDLIEVKGATEIKEYYEVDIAFQRYVFEKAGYKIRKSILLYIDKTYVRQGELDYKKLFVEVDMTQMALERRKEVKENILTLCKVLNRKKAPEVEIGGQCSQGYQCGFSDFCHQHIPAFSVYNIFKSNDSRLAFCLDKGILDIKKIPKTLELTERQSKIVDAHKKNRVIIEKENIGEFVAKLQYPLYYLDYESINPAI